VAYGMYLFICGLFILAINSPHYVLSISIQVLQSHNIISLAQVPEGAGWFQVPPPPENLWGSTEKKNVFLFEYSHVGARMINTTVLYARVTVLNRIWGKHFHPKRYCLYAQPQGIIPQQTTAFRT